MQSLARGTHAHSFSRCSAAELQMLGFSTDEDDPEDDADASDDSDDGSPRYSSAHELHADAEGSPAQLSRVEQLASTLDAVELQALELTMRVTDAEELNQAYAARYGGEPLLCCCCCSCRRPAFLHVAASLCPPLLGLYQGGGGRGRSQGATVAAGAIQEPRAAAKPGGKRRCALPYPVCPVPVLCVLCALSCLPMPVHPSVHLRGVPPRCARHSSPFNAAAVTLISGLSSILSTKCCACIPFLVYVSPLFLPYWPGFSDAGGDGSAEAAGLLLRAASAAEPCGGAPQVRGRGAASSTCRHACTPM